ncbi:hypothetical protein [Escherichia albertii]|uniref:hypothetical protein n=1 Tax=Escherichia albertii TaxID=208962 RepID=UPI0007437195|nr:hypothetical protein [Escherichia albertii]EFF0834046.1 hypothetical protein [Escherichia albertii]EFF1430146.1 hypothetical protein [Escherichia albertii]EFL5787540.1 hypothetical protein [Escherichia albertii]EFL5797089.1 hypothetical protein [Escherichia albertii]EJC8325682.1 hypothetical protein [Escherichia albertii]
MINFTKNGDCYVVNKQNKLSFLLGCFWFLLAIYFLYTHHQSIASIIASIFLFFLAGLMFLKMRTEMLFDIKKNIFYIKNGNAKPKFIHSFDELDSVDVVYHKRFLGLMKHGAIFLRFTTDGKKVSMPILQIGADQTQALKVIEELEIILGRKL